MGGVKLIELDNNITVFKGVAPPNNREINNMFDIFETLLRDAACFIIPNPGRNNPLPNMTETYPNNQSALLSLVYIIMKQLNQPIRLIAFLRLPTCCE